MKFFFAHKQRWATSFIDMERQNSFIQLFGSIKEKYSFSVYFTASNILKRISSSEPGNIMSTGYTNGGGVGASRSSSIKVGTTERLEKILFELVETEKAYVKVR